MRWGGNCTIQQTLTTEAASVLKLSLDLARRRGHAHLTPLHVAATLLTSTTTTPLLRRACLQSHPLQSCRALELCFNVALNRLPTALTPTPTPTLILDHSNHPSLSNALIAALKRAQAHQKKGAIDHQQQQPLPAVKVELEQLIISILDDPSVSRVMREAGFSSTAVKGSVEDATGAVFHHRHSFITSSAATEASFWAAHFLSCTASLLKPGAVPSTGLRLGLNDSSVGLSHQPSQVLEMKPSIGNRNSKEEEEKLGCCLECASNYEKEAQLFKPNLAPWLQSQATTNLIHQKELRRKWNALCHSLHQQGGQADQKTNLCWWLNQKSSLQDSNSISFANRVSPKHVLNFRRSLVSCTIDFNNVNYGASKEPSLGSLKKNTSANEVKVTLSLGNSFPSNLGNPEKLRNRDLLCKLLQQNVPWQSPVIPSVVEAFMDPKIKSVSTETYWLLIEGNDMAGKRRLAATIAESALGSAALLLHLNAGRKDDSDLAEMLARALNTQTRFVAFVEHVDLANTQFLKFLANVFETGNFGESTESWDENIRRKATMIFILTRGDEHIICHDSVMQITLEVNRTASTASDEYKRKAEWNTVSSKSKSPRTNEKLENGNRKEELSRQSGFNTLDLNIKADEEDGDESRAGEFIPVSRDLTGETTSEPHTPRGFLDLIKNRFTFEQNEDQHGNQGTEVLVSKMRRGFVEVFGEGSGVGFSVEERVLEEVVDVAGRLVCSSFLVEKWVRDIFQRSLEAVRFRAEEGLSLRVCFGGRSEKVFDDGFMGTCLPNQIHLSF